jgi:hypothetical protein
MRNEIGKNNDAVLETKKFTSGFFFCNILAQLKKMLCNLL